MNEEQCVNERLLNVDVTHHSSLLAIERDSTVTSAVPDLGCSMVAVVYSIEIDFVLVDYSADAVELMTYPSMMN